MKKKRILALILSVAMLFGVMPKMQLFANTDDTATVYVDATNGSDENSGSESEPYKTIESAVNALETTQSENQIIKIMGEYTWNTNDLTVEHANRITITGNDSNAKINFNSHVHNKGGSLKLENITLYYSGGWCMYSYGNELILGDGIKTTFPDEGGWWVQMPSIGTGVYNSTKTHTKSQELSVNSGDYYNLFLGDSVIQTGTTNVIPGVDFTMNGGLFQNIIIGGNGWNGYYGINKYTGNVNLTFNGGTVNGSVMLLKSDCCDFNNQAVQLIFNNGATAKFTSNNSDSTFAEDVTACSGVLYQLNCAAQTGSYLETTDTAGTYTVNGDLYAVATDTTDSTNVHYSKDGKLVVPAGTYNVTWTSEVQTDSWNVTSEDVEGTNIVPTDYENKFNVTTPANKMAVAVDSENNVAYVGEDKSVADKTPETNYTSTKYTEWGCFDNNGTYLTNTYKKLTEDKELTVVYFGGSLTAGFGCGQSGDPNGDTAVTHDSKSWRALVGQWLTDSFPDATINNINAAIGESGTYLGTYRVQTDIISQEPDLLFIEYAINDNYFGSSETEAALMFETIVREVKQALPNCDVITVLTTDKAKMSTTYAGDLFNTAKGHNTIAEAYNLPVVNIGLGLAQGIAEKENSTTWWEDSTIWSKYFYDDVHPFSTGHEQYYLCMEEFLENNLLKTDFDGVDTSRSNLPAVQSEYLLDGNRQNIFGADMKEYYVSGSNASYNDGIFRAGTSATQRKGYYQISANGSITFKFSGTEFALWSDLLGNFSYSVDDGASQSVTSSTHQPTQVVENLTSGEHTITITPNQDMKIAAVFARDESVQTVRGTTYEYPDYKGMTLTLPAGSYKVYYVTTVGELPIPTAPEGQRFAGWMDADSNVLKDTDLLVKGMILTATWETVYEVFVAATSGNDENDGLSRDSAFQTLTQAVTAIESSDKASGVINIVGTYTIKDALLTLNNANKPITIQGADGTESILQFNIRTVLGGTTTFDNITITGDKIITCMRNTVTFGSGVNMQVSMEVITGDYGQLQVFSVDKRESLTIDNVIFANIWMGNYASNKNVSGTNVSKGIDYVQNGGAITNLQLGTNATNETNCAGNVYQGTVNITINGGTIGSASAGGILLNDSSYVLNNGDSYKNSTQFRTNAVQIIFNNGTKANVHSAPTASEIAAKGGTPYILNCAANAGSYLLTTNTAGTYVVMGDVQAMATDTTDSTKVYYSENGQLVVPTGTYDVTWKVDESPLSVYVNETDGDDTNSGLSCAKAFKTLNAAVSAIEASEKPSGVINVIGKVTIDNATQSKNLTTHSKMIVVKGVDDDSNLYLS